MVSRVSPVSESNVDESIISAQTVLDKFEGELIGLSHALNAACLNSVEIREKVKDLNDTNNQIKAAVNTCNQFSSAIGQALKSMPLPHLPLPNQPSADNPSNSVNENKDSRDKLSQESEESEKKSSEDSEKLPYLACHCNYVFKNNFYTLVQNSTIACRILCIPIGIIIAVSTTVYGIAKVIEGIAFAILHLLGSLFGKQGYSVRLSGQSAIISLKGIVTSVTSPLIGLYAGVSAIIAPHDMLRMNPRDIMTPRKSCS